jgi:hypothetical protein
MMTIDPRTGTVAGRMLAACVGGVAAAVLLVAGCSDGESHNDRAAKISSVATPPPTGPAGVASASATPQENDAENANRIPPGPKVPKSELTPATGSITKKQKEYLTDRVPKGVDPAAILEAGQEACDRVAEIAEHDHKAAIQAIKSGEITGARDAIKQLCPEQEPLLKAAEK